MAYNLVACGGTFDHFHKGHESFLRYVFSVGKKVIVGVTSDEYIKSSKFKVQSSKLIEPFKKRKQAVLRFLEKEKVLNQAEIVKIDDLFGPTLNKDLAIDAIVVSKETEKGAEIINQKRKELGLKDLKIIVAPLIYAEDGKLISSERIRQGEINREGKLYIKPTWLKTDLILPENLREEFKKPFGELLMGIGGLSENKNSLTITVGDVATKIFNEKSLGQNLSVVDFKVAREKKFEDFKELGFVGDEIVFNVINPASHITHNLFLRIENIFKSGFDQRIILKIEGEEDLAVLPLVLTAPLGAIIYYGQPHKGLVEVKVSEGVKNKAYNLILRLKQA